MFASSFCKIDNDTLLADSTRSLATCMADPSKLDTKKRELQTAPGKCKTVNLPRAMQIGSQVAAGKLNIKDYVEDITDYEQVSTFMDNMQIMRDTGLTCDYTLNANGVKASSSNVIGVVPESFYKVTLKKDTALDKAQEFESGYVGQAMTIASNTDLENFNKRINTMYGFELLNQPIRLSAKPDEVQEASEASGTPVAPPASSKTTSVSTAPQVQSTSTEWDDSVKGGFIAIVVIFVIFLLIMFIILTVMFSFTDSQTP